MLLNTQYAILNTIKMKTLILAAGYATRLYPLTREYPKPLLTIGKRPIIDLIIDKQKAMASINEIIVVTNTKFMPIFKLWKATLAITTLGAKKKVTLVDDLTRSHAERRGAIGDLSFAIDKKHLKEDLLVIGGDNLFEGDLKYFLSFARSKRPYVVMGVYDIEKKGKAKHYGVVQLNRMKRIINFQEKPKEPKSTLVAMCLYYFPKEALERVKEYLRLKSDKHDATGFFIEWLRKQEPIYGFEFKGHWYDIGYHDSYSEAREKFQMKT